MARLVRFHTRIAALMLGLGILTGCGPSARTLSLTVAADQQFRIREGWKDGLQARIAPFPSSTGKTSESSGTCPGSRNGIRIRESADSKICAQTSGRLTPRQRPTSCLDLQAGPWLDGWEALFLFAGQPSWPTGRSLRKIKMSKSSPTNWPISSERSTPGNPNLPLLRIR